MDARGGTDGHCELELPPSLREHLNILDKPSFPDGSSENFDKEFFPRDSVDLGHERSNPHAYSLEVRIASIGTELDIFCYSLTERFHPTLDGLAIWSDLLGVGNIFQTRSSRVRAVCSNARV